MGSFKLIKVLIRRWYVVLPVGLLTLGLVYYVQASASPEYQATGWVVLESPELADPANTARLIDPVELARGIHFKSEEPDFTVSPLGGNNYTIAAAAPSPRQAESDVVEVLTQLNESLVELQSQDGVPSDQRVDVRMVEPDVVAEAQPDATYLATATVFLYDPTTAVENPYLANASTGRLLQVAVTGDASRREFVGRAGTGLVYEVAQQARDTAPLIQIVTLGSDPAKVVDAFYVVQEMMAQGLDARQVRADVFPNRRITMRVIDAPVASVDDSSPVDLAAAGILGFGGLLALALALGLDGPMRRWQEETAAPVSIVPTHDDGDPEPPGSDRHLGNSATSDKVDGPPALAMDDDPVSAATRCSSL